VLRKMIEKERLLAIPALKLAGKIEKMSNEQMELYEQQLIAFIENFPSEEEKIKTALAAILDKEVLNKGIDFGALINNLHAMCRTLEKLHADDLVREYHKRIGELKEAEREQVEAFVTGLLSTVATLSIDIQMAKYLKAGKHEEKKGAESANAQSAAVEKTILAVDDAMISLNILKKNLQGSPYKLICVNSGKDALMYLKQHQPDLFILDIEMPKMDGYELAKKIKEAGQPAPIIFLTGNATRENVMKAIEAGGLDFVVKPIDKGNLAEKIYKHIYAQNA